MKSILVASLRIHEMQIELAAALDDLLEDPVDRVLVAVGEAGHGAAGPGWRIRRTKRAADGNFASCGTSENRLRKSLS